MYSGWLTRSHGAACGYVECFMLKIACPLMLTLLAGLAQPAHAQDRRDAPRPAAEAGLCQPVCASARQDCRAQAQGATENDGSPVLSMKPSSNPYVAAGRNVDTQAEQLRPTEAQAFRARRAERLQACEVRYRSCVRTCG